MTRTVSYENKDYHITGITSDSRKVQSGMMFVAIRGTILDGTDFIDDAITKGARIILTHTGTRLPDSVQGIYVDNPRHVYAQLCGQFYHLKPPHIMAVTGTNGKTSVAHFYMQLCHYHGKKSMCVGTMGVLGDGARMTDCLTTPEPAILHHILQSACVQHGVTHVGLEASSHGLDMYRLDGVPISVAGFTNISRDHLDYHGDMETYIQAKMRLFRHILSADGTAVINRNAPEFHRIASICKTRGITVVSYDVYSTDADIYMDTITLKPTGFDVCICVFGQKYSVSLGLIGAFQLENVACAVAMAIQGGIPVENAVSYMEELHPVCGRMQYICTTPNGGSVYVDYAHTSDALKTVLKALRCHTHNRLLAVIGCGGDRDVGKRPMMGDILQRYADIGYVTDDNPRSEDAHSIRNQILAGAGDTCVDAGNRENAIRMAMQDLEHGDILVVAGKGHETGQVIGDTTYDFNDADVINKVRKTL